MRLPYARTGSTVTAGRLLLAGAALGVAGGLITGFFPPAVTEDRYSYPYQPAGFVLMQLVFLANHLLLLVGFLGLGRSGAAGPGWLGRVGVGLAVAGTALLSSCEIGAATQARAAYPSAGTDVLDIGFGVASTVIGVGLLLAGVGVLRTGRWDGWRRWSVLAAGVAMFVVVIPGVFGPFLAGRLVLVFWMLLIGGIGFALLAPEPAARSERVGSVPAS